MSNTSSLSAVEINDIFDAIACSEETIVQKAFQEGLRKGIEEGENEGYHLGFHKGADIGSEIGYYEGVITTLVSLHESKEIDLSNKVVTTLLKLKQLLAAFPHFNCPNTNILQLRNEIKSYFKQCCSLLKFDGTLTEKGLSF